MSLKEQIGNDMKEAMKAKDSVTLGTLRMITSILNNELIEKKAKGEEELTDEDVLKVLKREKKKREESIKMYLEGGREELAEGEKKELEVIAKYLPEEMPIEEVEKIVKKIVEGGADNMGDIMKAAMAETKGRANGKVVSEIAKRLLA